MTPEVMPSTFDEKSLDKASFPSALQFVQENALQKALEVARRPGLQYDLVIGSDSVVVLDGKILEKPESDGEAADMIAALSGNRHVVATGVALVFHGPNGAAAQVHETFVCETSVKFSRLTAAEIEAYIRHQDHGDKAGGYGCVCARRD